MDINELRQERHALTVMFHKVLKAGAETRTILARLEEIQSAILEIDMYVAPELDENARHYDYRCKIG